MKFKDLHNKSLMQEIDFYMLILRWSTLFASALIYFISKYKTSLIVPPIIILLILLCINLPVSIFIWRNEPYKNKQLVWILILDILQGFLSVALTGGYDSLFFVMYLLSITEAGICFNWQLAAGWIASINGIQIISTTLHWAATENTVSSYALVSRFVRLLIVGLIVIMLGELLRREEEHRIKVMTSATNLKKLNEIFTEFETTNFDNSRVFDILLSSIKSIQNVEYSFVLFCKDNQKGIWEIKATSSPDIYPKGSKLDNLINYKCDTLIFRKTTDDINVNTYFFRENAKEVIGINLSAYDEEIKGLLIIGKNRATTSIDDEDFFLKALALEAQLVLHNTYIFQKKQEQIKQLAKFKEMQTTFFSAAGHEIKTPLTILKTMQATLQLTIYKPTNDQKEILEILKANINRLDSLTTDILETAKLESSELQLNRKNINLSKLMNTVIKAMTPIAVRKKQQIILKVIGSPENSNTVFIFGDHKRISQIISNLLSNALKFSPSGSTINIEIDVKGTHTLVCIFDSGPTLSQEEENKIFDKYYTSSQDKALSGFGLGLYIVKKLVDLHDGEIWIQKRTGEKGFCFTLPQFEGENYGET